MTNQQANEEHTDILSLAADEWNDAVSERSDKREMQVRLARLLSLRRQQHARE
jgi:hypothetical protein